MSRTTAPACACLPEFRVDVRRGDRSERSDETVAAVAFVSWACRD